MQSASAISRTLSFLCSSSLSTSTHPRAGPGPQLSRRWAEFQGSQHWEGLLNPVHPTLRSEILRYGSFVQSAYSLSSCPSHELPRSSGYLLTRTLFASPSPTPIGFVAASLNPLEVSRLGRRDLVVSLRGTLTIPEWLSNLRATLTPLSLGSAVGTGFWDLFTSLGPARPSLRDQIRHEVCRLVSLFDAHGPPVLSITIAGHSLGAALAVLAADDLAAALGPGGPVVTVFSFGGPRVANSGFRRMMEERGTCRVLRIVNAGDVVTKVPGFSREPARPGPGWLFSKLGWAYADIGRELRLASHTANVLECHDLRYYLKLVAGLDGQEKTPEAPQRWPATAALNIPI